MVRLIKECAFHIELISTLMPENIYVFLPFNFLHLTYNSPEQELEPMIYFIIYLETG